MRAYLGLRPICRVSVQVVRSQSAYVIGPVMRPDEYHYHVNNRFFTNYLLRWCITYALSWTDRGFLPAVHDDELNQ